MPLRIHYVMAPNAVRFTLSHRVAHKEHPLVRKQVRDFEKHTPQVL